jgi:D-alanine-D-alanine ligase
MSKLKVGLFFGGRSTEHEVSVLTAIQAYENLDLSKYEVYAVYVSKRGDFYINPKFLDLKNFRDIDSLILSSTKIEFIKGGIKTKEFFSKKIILDVALLSFHGSFGEDGCMQGLLEMYQVPYTGFNVISSALAMDKVVSKAIFKELGLLVCDYTEVKRIDWILDSNSALKRIQRHMKYPLFVKPATIGSSIGVNKAEDEDSLSFALEVAFTYSEKVLVEKKFEGLTEVNCSVLGYLDAKASVCESPTPSADILSFADKYLKGSSKSFGMASLSRIIPAPISDKLTKQIQEASIKVFKAMDGCGVARIDYFVDKKSERFWINEINSPPGSFAYYLWEKTGVKFPELLDILIEDGLKRAENQKKTQFTFESGLLSSMAKAGGLKA